ncbi:MAG: FAD-binding oxidoreductase [Cytophagales bacterium]|nr:MAG: FAD-binding oxidoreductase [Cytophagales bacterium]
MITNSLQLTGTVLKQGERGFDQAVLDTLFNKVNPGQRPAVMVCPQTIDDVINAVRYARSAGQTVSICSGGHSWSANHVRAGSILINMRGFNQYTVDREAMTARVGPGVGGSTLLTALTEQGLFFPAGHCKGVCVGGYLLQGGFGWHGRKLGMACENVIGLDIVTAEGELVHASPTQNPDLYWSARGSGGGFFGVVVCFHLQLFPKPKHMGMATHVFSLRHMESVFRWAHEVGPSVPNTVEFQILTSRRVLQYLWAGMEVIAPVFADSRDELEASLSFMNNSPVRKKAFIRLPYRELPMATFYNYAMTHYPDNHCWGVDNMWTKAGIDDLMPHLHRIADTLPPAPSHFLWLNWYPPKNRPDMAFSMEDHLYLALYGTWKSGTETPRYGNWAHDHMQTMAHLSTGIQLADEGLHKRTAPFVSAPHLQRLDVARGHYDPDGLFNAWHSRP